MQSFKSTLKVQKMTLEPVVFFQQREHAGKSSERSAFSVVSYDCSKLHQNIFLSTMMKVFMDKESEIKEAPIFLLYS